MAEPAIQPADVTNSFEQFKAQLGLMQVLYLGLSDEPAALASFIAKSVKKARERIVVEHQGLVLNRYQ